MAAKGTWKPKISSKLLCLFTKRCFRSNFYKIQNGCPRNFFLFFTQNDRSWSPKHFLLIYWHSQINISWSKWPPKVLRNQKFNWNCLISSPKGASGQKEHFFVKSKMAALRIFFLFFTHNDRSWSPKHFCWYIGTLRSIFPGQNGRQRCSEMKNFIEIASSLHQKVFQVKRSIFRKIQNGRQKVDMGHVTPHCVQIDV